jgi:hypothetical protein
MDSELDKLRAARVALEESAANLEASVDRLEAATTLASGRIERMKAHRLFNPARMTTPRTDD